MTAPGDIGPADGRLGYGSPQAGRSTAAYLFCCLFQGSPVYIGPDFKPLKGIYHRIYPGLTGNLLEVISKLGKAGEASIA